MALNIQTQLAYQLDGPTDLILQIEAAAIPEQTILRAHINAGDVEHFVRVRAQDAVGDRIWIRTEGQLTVSYNAIIDVHRLTADIAALPAVPPHQLPGETVQYLMDSRYCQASLVQNLVDDEFGDLKGGARVAAMRDWVNTHFRYTPGSSDANTTAIDSLVERRGVCRDYAHVMIALARASTIPARMASVYAPDVDPPDFHAVAEVFLADPPRGLGGAWHLVDATGMAEQSDMAKIGIGRDAADVSFLTIFGKAELLEQSVSVVRA